MQYFAIYIVSFNLKDSYTYTKQLKYTPPTVEGGNHPVFCIRTRGKETLAKNTLVEPNPITRLKCLFLKMRNDSKNFVVQQSDIVLKGKK